MPKQYRILIVEDEERWREDILREALEDKRHRIDTSDSYRKAVAALRRRSYDLVVVDVNLTGVAGNRDGIRIVEWLASHGDKTPVVVVSGSKTRDAAQKALKQFRPVAFLDKTTFDIGEFVKIVAGALGSGGGK